MKKLLVMFAMAVTLIACNNSSDGTTTIDITNSTKDTPNVMPGGTINSDTSHSSAGDTSNYATGGDTTTKR